jgi:hypothetical protein
VPRTIFRSERSTDSLWKGADQISRCLPPAREVTVRPTQRKQTSTWQFSSVIWVWTRSIRWFQTRCDRSSSFEFAARLPTSVGRILNFRFAGNNSDEAERAAYSERDYVFFDSSPGDRLAWPRVLSANSRYTSPRFAASRTPLLQRAPGVRSFDVKKDGIFRFKYRIENHLQITVTHIW